MILSNVEIVRCLKSGLFSISSLTGEEDPAKDPFNTSAVDLHLGKEILVPKRDSPVQIDLTQSGIAKYIKSNSDFHEISNERPFALTQQKFVLGQTLESVNFPLNKTEICYSARVEGRSSLARCGILVHFTAPTIHAGFNGTITLEIINLGPQGFLLKPNMAVCQLIIEEVKGSPANASNQFRGQKDAAGVI